MKTDVKTSLKERKSNLGEVFECAYWMAKFAYLSDIFTILNEFNLSLRGRAMRHICPELRKALNKQLLNSFKRMDTGIYDIFLNTAE
jgi:hypothetical protein